MKKPKNRIRLQSKKPQLFNYNTALQHIAQRYMWAERKLTPLIKSEQMAPNEAVVLIATYTDTMIMGEGKEHWMTEEDVIGASKLLIELWEKGLFVPSPEYPYTLEETLQFDGSGDTA